MSNCSFSNNSTRPASTLRGLPARITAFGRVVGLTLLAISPRAWGQPECGPFGPPQVISTEVDDARSVFACDIDGDGDTDVLSASTGDNKIAWYENLDGAGTFGPQRVISSTTPGAFWVFAGDLDGDGDNDVLAAAKYGHKIVWHENLDGEGNFGPQQIISTQVDGPVAVVASDLDGDGDLDVLSASWEDDKIAWYENIDGAGTFGPQQIISTETDGAWSVFAADLDGDGDIDVLSGSLHDDKVAWFENLDGEGLFSSLHVISTEADALRSVFAADLDGDGDIDVLSASQLDEKLAWYENTDGLGSFGPEQIISFQANGPSSVFAADIDGDLDLDVLSASNGDEKVAWYENLDGAGNFGPQQIISTAVVDPFRIFAVDLDGDDDIDVLSASGTSGNTGTIAWHENLNDCNGNGIADECDLDDGSSPDCNGNAIPDECDITEGTSEDCNGNASPDECDLSDNGSQDCNENMIPDECDISEGMSDDCNTDGVPDECAPCVGDLDCDGVVDAFDLAILLGSWGPCPEPPEPCPADIFGTGDGFVGADDLAFLLGSWGPCP